MIEKDIDIFKTKAARKIGEKRQDVPRKPNDEKTRKKDRKKSGGNLLKSGKKRLRKET